MVNFIKRILRFLKESFVYFIAIDGTLKAAALAYATLVSIVPLMLLSLFFVLAFPNFASYFQELHLFIFQQLVPSAATSIQEYAEMFALNAVNLSTSGVIFFLLTAVILIFTMETVFNRIWEVKTRRQGISVFFMYSAILILLPPIGGIAIALGLFLKTLPFISVFFEIMGFIIPFALSWLGYLLLFTLVPNTTVKFRDAAVGAAVSSLLFEITKWLFSIYVTKFSSDTIIYGVMAALPGFLLWLYLSWTIIIFGAVISFRYSQLTRHKKRRVHREKT